MDKKPTKEKGKQRLQVLSVVMTVFIWPSIMGGIGYGTYTWVAPYLPDYADQKADHIFLATTVVLAAVLAFCICVLALSLRMVGSSIPKMFAKFRAESERKRVTVDEQQRPHQITAERTRLTTTVDGILSVIPEAATVFRYLARDKSVGMVVDGTEDTVTFVTRGKDNVSTVRRYPFADILAVDLVEDGSSIARTQTNRASQIGGAIVGGILTGGIGVLVGGLSGGTRTKTTNIVERIDVVVTVHDAERPSHMVNFYRRGWPYSPSDIKTAMQDAREWAGRFKVVMHAEDSKARDAWPTITQSTPTLSVSDEIRKLKALYDDGLIDADELAVQRARLLG